MPIECPIPFGEDRFCDECHLYRNGKCWWFLPPREITEILTGEERMLRLEHPEPHTPEPEFVKRQWDIVNQLRAEVRFLSSKVTELRAKKSEQRTNRYNKYLS